MQTVTILCASPRSVYRDLPGTDVYDQRRDARTYTGTTPTIAHPPCRAWSCHLATQAKPQPGEKDLAWTCLRIIQQNGGILEHPAFSRFWLAARLPPPLTQEHDFSWTLECWQHWWGLPVMKRTWLYFAKIPRNALPPIPFRLLVPTSQHKLWNTLSRSARSRTPRPFAEWLLTAARLVRT